MLVTLNVFADTGWLFQPYYTQGTNNPTNTATAGNKGTLYFNTNASPNTVFMKTDDFVSTNWFSLLPAASPAITGTPTVNGGKATDVYYSRTCQITSAAAATPIHCLLAADIGAAQKPFITGFKAKVNGSTSWATTTICTLKDSSAATTFVTIAVAAMTGNAYIVSSTANVTLGNAFALGTGGTVANGVDLACDANGTGSTMVVTIEGFLN